MCDPQLPTRNISPAPSSIQSASSGSTICKYQRERESEREGDIYIYYKLMN